MRIVKLDETNSKIIELSKKGIYFSQLKQALAIEGSMLSHRLHSLEAASPPLITKTGKGNLTMIQATDEALKRILMQHRAVVDTSSVYNNLQALEVHYLLFPTSYSKIPAILASLGIVYTTSGRQPAPFYHIQWTKDISIKITTRKLIATGPELYELLEIRGEEIVNKGLGLNMKDVQAFLDKTNIRCRTSVDGKLIATIRYKEIAVGNEALAREAVKHRGRIELAYDRVTGKCTIWADRTPPPAAMETNVARNNEVIAKQAQGIQDGIIDPYADEMRSRARFERIERNLEEYSEKLNAHIPFFDTQAKINQMILDALLPKKAAKKIRPLTPNQTKLIP